MKSKQMRSLAKEECEMQMTPMIDVVFLLLIFFMCTLKFKTLEGKLSAYLPADVGVNPPDADPIEKVEVLVRVTSPGNKLRPDGTKYTNDDEAQRKRFIYDDSRELEYSVGPRKIRDIEELARRLLDLALIARYQAGPNWDWSLALRSYDRKIETNELFNDTQLNLLQIQVGYSW